MARAFGYSAGSFRVLCHHFRREPTPSLLRSPAARPAAQPKKAAARDLIVALRKQNPSVYEISDALKERDCPLSPTAVREVLKAEGFAPLPRRLDEERPDRPPAHARSRSPMSAPSPSRPADLPDPLRRTVPLPAGPGAARTSTALADRRAPAGLHDDSRRRTPSAPASR